MAHPGGRPKKFETPEQLQKLIDDYFLDCKKNKLPLTYAGLAVAIGIDRRSLYNYSKDEEFFLTIKKARDKVEQYVEEQIFIRGSAGVIFYAKNYGYTDRQDVNITPVNFGASLDKFVDKLGDTDE